MMRYQKIRNIIFEIDNIAGASQDMYTNEPLFYDFINRTQEIMDLTTPWWVRLWEKWLASRPLKADQIPF